MQAEEVIRLRHFFSPILATDRVKLSFEPGSIDAGARLLPRLDPSQRVALGQKAHHHSEQSRFVELLDAKGQLLRDNDAISPRASFLHAQTILRRAMRNHCEDGLPRSGLAPAERPHLDGMQVKLRRIPVAYLVLPVASLKMNRICEDNAVSCALSEPEMERGQQLLR
jgi:hypothetical protein